MAADLPTADLPPVDLGQSVHLLELARGGDDDALNDLLVRYQDRLRRIVRVRLGARLREKVQSNDIVQESLVVAARKVRETDLRSSGAILNWLSRIAEHKIHDAHDYFSAKRRDQKREVQPCVVISGESVGWDPPADQSSPDRRLERSEVTEIVDTALSELTEDHREVILLRQYCGNDWKEIASAFDRSVEAVQELHRRAWAKLREVVQPRLQAWAD